MANWYYAEGLETRGPVSEDELRAMARRGELTPNTYVVPQGNTLWVLIGSAEARLGLVRSATGGYDPATTTPTDTTPTASSPAPRPFGEQTWGSPEPQPTPQDQPIWSPPARQDPTGWAPPGPYDHGAAQPPWGPTQPQPWGPPVAGAPWGHPQDGLWAAPDYASWGQRALAKLLDFFILLFPTMLITLITLVIAGNGIRNQLQAADGTFDFTALSGTRSLTIASIVAGLIALAYYATFNGKGQTPGKRALGIVVVRAAGDGPVGPSKGFARHVIQFLENVPLLSIVVFPFVLVDSLWPLWDGRKQALHDKIAGSVVLRTR